MRLLLLLILLVCGAAASAGEVPYQAVYRALYPSLKLQNYSHLAPVQRILSKDPSVPASDIRIEILAQAGTIAVPIQPDGKVQFPLADDLLAENPTVRSNQPQGSLSVSVSFEVQVGKKLQMPYDDLLAGMDEAAHALADVDPNMAGANVAGLEFSFSPGIAAELHIVDAKRDEKLVAGDQGFVRLRNDPMLKGATVRWSTTPLRVMPFLRGL